jgi:hypothetical protein
MCFHRRVHLTSKIDAPPRPVAGALAIISALVSAGCAVRNPAALSWRLTDRSGQSLLIPPRPAPKDHVTIRLPEAPHGGERTERCPHSIEIKRDELLAQPPGWLQEFSEDLERRRCLKTAEAPEFARNIADTFPLNPQTAFKLLHTDDISPPILLQVVSPILTSPDTPDEPLQTTGDGNSLNLTLKAPAGFIGYETAVYSTQPKPSGGFAITALYADRHINQTTEHTPKPATNYFNFAANAAYYRLIMKSGQTNFTALVIAAPTRAELSRESVLADSADGSCDKLPPGHCIAIPKRVAINEMIPVKVNGNDLLVRWAADVAEALRDARIRSTDVVLIRPWKGHAVPVNVDSGNQSVLKLPLQGGEEITTSTPKTAPPGPARNSGASPPAPAETPPAHKFAAPHAEYR